MKKDENLDYDIVDFTIIGAVQENMISVQQIYKTIQDIDGLNKQTITGLDETKCNELIQKSIDVININKQNVFEDRLKYENVLDDEQKTNLKSLVQLDNSFNSEINRIVETRLRKKIFEEKSFGVVAICKELNKVYERYV